MGGRVAEEIFLHHMTTGAGNDIERATEIARDMVCEWGMSNLGPLAFGKNQQEIFLGRDIATQRDFSEDTAIKIDQEVKKFRYHGLRAGQEYPDHAIAKFWSASRRPCSSAKFWTPAK